MHSNLQIGRREPSNVLPARDLPGPRTVRRSKTGHAPSLREWLLGLLVSDPLQADMPSRLNI